jgi:hypothetical protein
MTIQAGTRVKAHKDFNFEMFSGPRNHDDLGTVDHVTEQGEYMVKWDHNEGRLTDHAPSEDTFLNYAVVAAE